jgi:hypothetical protein
MITCRSSEFIDLTTSICIWSFVTCTFIWIFVTYMWPGAPLAAAMPRARLMALSTSVGPAADVVHPGHSCVESQDATLRIVVFFVESLPCGSRQISGTEPDSVTSSCGFAESHWGSRHIFPESAGCGSRQSALCWPNCVKSPLPRLSSRHRLCREKTCLCQKHLALNKGYESGSE